MPAVMLTAMHDTPIFEMNTDIEAMHTQHPISWNNDVNFAAKTLLDVVLPGLVLTPRKLGKTRL